MQVGDFVKGLPNNGYSVTDEDMTKGVVTKVVEDTIKVKIINHKRGCKGIFDVCADKFEIIGHVKKFNRSEVFELINRGCIKAILDYDLRYADLRYANLKGADLNGANLKGADLRGADLTDADLNGANLKGADLRYADLRYANLRGADLNGANLKGADLRYADLRGADLNGADLRYADLRYADLRGANIDFSCYPLWCGSLGLKADKRLACQLAYHLCSMQCDDTEFVKMRNSVLSFANQFHRADECGVLEPIEEEVA